MRNTQMPHAAFWFLSMNTKKRGKTAKGGGGGATESEKVSGK